jgi:hypothetical protein
MIRWSHLFIDRPVFDPSFWLAVTGTHLSARRGADGEFATLLPPDGDAHLKFQAVGDDGGAHLDLDVSDVPAYTAQAVALGARVIRAEERLSVMRSPAGQSFCLCDRDGPATRSAPLAAGGATSRVDQICIDVAPGLFEAEVVFWGALTGWTSAAGSRPEFHVVRPDASLPVRILLQRLDSPRPTGAHVDIACSDVAAVRAWHESLGATFVADGPRWTVMRDPVGGVYCLTGRNPVTGTL